MRSLVLLCVVGALAAMPVPAVGDGARRVLVKIDAAGVSTKEDGGKLGEGKALVGYLIDRRHDSERLGISPPLHIVADDETKFIYVREIVRAGAKAGIRNVIFRPAKERKAAPGEAPKKDHKLSLPDVAPKDDQLGIQPFFIKIARKGEIYANVGPSREELDTDPKKRDLPLLDQRLKIYVLAAKLGNSKPRVQVYVEQDAKFRRLLDLLTVLRKHEINEVTFTDLVD